MHVPIRLTSRSSDKDANVLLGVFLKTVMSVVDILANYKNSRSFEGDKSHIEQITICNRVLNYYKT